MFVIHDTGDGSSWARDLDRVKLVLVETRRPGLGVPLLGRAGEPVARIATDREILPDLLGRFGHGLVSVHRCLTRIGKSRAQRRIKHLGLSSKGVRRLAHDKRGATHALDATRDKHVTVVTLHGAAGVEDGGQATRTEAIDRHSRNLNR